MGETVTVACKLPAGIKLDVRGEVTTVSDRTFAPKLGEFTLNGSAPQRRMESDGVETGVSPHVVAGYGLTEVDADLFAKWKEQNAESELVKNTIVFAMPKIEAVRAKAKDVSKSVKTGLEPIDPVRDVRMNGFEKAEDVAAA